MDKAKNILVLVIFLVFLGTSASFAQVSSPEGENSYGSQGTRELGLSGSISFPIVITDGPTGSPDEIGPTTTTLQPFFKYFYRDRIHFDVSLLYQKSFSEKSDFQAESETTISVFFPSIGYSYPVSPKLQVDASVNLGFLSFTADDESDSAFSYGLKFMALSPISERAVLGIGIVLTWTTIEFDTEEITILQRIVPIQVSYYF